jgi:hypothetical protein
MSRAIFAQLPVFSEPDDDQPVDWTPVPDADHDLPEVDENGADQLSGMSDLPPADSLPDPGRDEAALEAVMNSLCVLAERVEAEANTKMSQTLRSLAAELLPELSRAFLADEIMRHLPSLLPPKAVRFEIRAAAAIADRIGVLAGRHPMLAGRFDIIATEGADPGAAEISWQTGGVKFDFHRLITACLARLETVES